MTTHCSHLTTVLAIVTLTEQRYIMQYRQNLIHHISYDYCYYTVVVLNISTLKINISQITKQNVVQVHTLPVQRNDTDEKSADENKKIRHRLLL